MSVDSNGECVAFDCSSDGGVACLLVTVKGVWSLFLVLPIKEA